MAPQRLPQLPAPSQKPESSEICMLIVCIKFGFTKPCLTTRLSATAGPT